MKNNTETIAPVKTKFFTMERTKSVLSIMFIILVTLQAGIVIGWQMRTEDFSRTKSEASAIVQSQLKADK